jgi:glycerate kinase
MKVVLAPNALKGSLTATEAAEAMARGVRRACGDADIVQVPASDGGDGLIDVLVHALGGELRTAMITGLRGDPVKGSFGYIPNRNLAIIEMALVSGLKLLSKDKRNPIETTTYGTGELIAAALSRRTRSRCSGSCS